jgi:catalase
VQERPASLKSPMTSPAFTSAGFFNTVGKKTKLFARFSTVAGGGGLANTVRDTTGFAFKIYTEDGNLDWLLFSKASACANSTRNQLVFPIRDGGKFPSFMHRQKGVPQNNLFSSSAVSISINAPWSTALLITRSSGSACLRSHSSCKAESVIGI